MRVLVVDDKADNAESLCLLLRLWGYEPVCADSGPEALALAQQFRPEAAIVEMLLPGLGGDEVGRRLRALPGLRRGGLIALSGCAATRRQALEAGFDLVLLKPAEPDDIMGALGPTASPWRSRPFRPPGRLPRTDPCRHPLHHAAARRPEEICALPDRLDH